MSARSELRRASDGLARLLAPSSGVAAADPNPHLPVSGGLGVLTAVNVDGTLSVTYNGGPVIANPLTDFTPIIGETVLVSVLGTQLWVLGPAYPSSGVVPWVDVASSVGYNADWSDLGTPFALGRYRLVGDLVQLGGAVLASSGAGTVPFPILPLGYRPTNDILMGGSFSSNAPTQINIGLNGSVNLNSVSAGNALQLDGLSFPIT